MLKGHCRPEGPRLVLVLCQLQEAIYTLTPQAMHPACEDRARFSCVHASLSVHHSMFKMAFLQGVVGESMPAKQLADQLEAKQQFLFFGHGAGDQYLPSQQLRRLHSSCACLLAGCSSGRLDPRGLYSPSGPILAYLLAGADSLSCRLSAARTVKFKGLYSQHLQDVLPRPSLLSNSNENCMM